MTIDEAIAQQKLASKFKREMWEKSVLREKNKHLLSQAKEHEQLAEWLEELKAIKSDGFTDDLLNMGFTKGYNKAIDDFVKFASDMPIVEEEDGEIRPMRLEEMAEQLKAGR